MNPSIESTIQWFQNRAGKVTYSMINRNGPNSYDCSSAGYYALKQGGFLPVTTPIGNTDSLFGDLERNRWVQLQPNAQGNFDTQRGDIAIWGKRGASAGAFGHFMLFVSADDVIHCSSGYNGIHTDNYDQLAGWNGWPEATFYRYSGSQAPANDPNDQDIEVGSIIKFEGTYTADDAQLIDGVWQVQSHELCPNNFTWADNGIPAELVVEVDDNGYATGDQNLDAGSKFKIPGKFPVLDYASADDMWIALIEWNGLKFWIDLAAATEIAASDPGNPTPAAAPTPTPANPTPPEQTQTDEPAAPVKTPDQPTQAPSEKPKKEDSMAFTQEQQDQLNIAAQNAQKVANDVAASEQVQDLMKGVRSRTKRIIYIVGDSLVGVGVIVPGLAVIFGWTNLPAIVAASSTLVTAGTFLLTMFGIYSNKN